MFAGIEACRSHIFEGPLTVGSELAVVCQILGRPCLVCELEETRLVPLLPSLLLRIAEVVDHIPQVFLHMLPKLRCVLVFMDV